MNIDRVARGMTAGRPKEGFTSRVMAPIYGRPRPGFTARVMQRLDEPRPARSRARVVFALVPIAAVAIVAGALLFARSGPLRIPTAPPAPRLTGMTQVASIAVPPVLNEPPAVKPRARIRAAQPPQAAEVLPEPPPIYTIAALEEPADIGLKAIGPEAPVIAPLDGPAPLKINEIKGNKEKSGSH